MSTPTPPAPPIEVPPLSGLVAQPWSWRKLWGMFASFGPAAIVASVAIGAGETILVVQLGSWSAYGLLWLVLTSSLTKGVFVTYLLGRYTAVSGEHIGHRLVKLPGPRGWLLWTIIAIELGSAPFAWTAIAKPSGDLLHQMLLRESGGTPGPRAADASLSPTPADDALVWKKLLASLAVASAVAAALAMNLKRLETGQLLICAVLVGGTLVCTLLVKPDLAAALRGLVQFGNIPTPPPWAPQEAVRHAYLNLATIFAYVGGSVMSYVAYANWVAMHRWGLTAHPDIDAIRDLAASRDRIDYLPADPAQVARLRRALAPMRWDVGIAAVVLFVVTAGFLASGAAVLYPLATRFEGWSLLTHQAYVWAAVSPYLIWVYYVSVLAALWGTLYAMPEIYARVTHEFLHAINPARHASYDQLKWRLAACVFVATLILVWSDVSFVVLTQVTAFLLAGAGIALVAVAAIYLNFLLPPPYRTRWWMLAGALASAFLITAATCLTGFGLLAKSLGH